MFESISGCWTPPPLFKNNPKKKNNFFGPSLTEQKLCMKHGHFLPKQFQNGGTAYPPSNLYHLLWCARNSEVPKRRGDGRGNNQAH